MLFDEEIHAHIDWTKMICLSSISISPHLMSFFEPLSRLVKGNVSYHYVVTKHDKERIRYGWSDEVSVNVSLASASGAKEVRQNAEVLVDAMREIDVLEKRQQEGRLSFYMSERWFKPPLGIIRLCHPRFFRTAYRMARLLSGKNVYYLAQGPAAARDMARICGIMRGKIHYFFRAPKISHERVPGARIKSVDCPNMFLWGYFVAPAKETVERTKESVLRILWVGRMLDWKRTKDLVVAVKKLALERSVKLDLYGEGPEKNAVCQLALGCDNITVNGFVKSDEVRKLMRAHDIFVLPSDGYEGWGATVSEALEEGMCVYGTYEAGSSSAMLPEDHLYHAGDVDSLVELLKRPLEYGSIGEWSGEKAALRFRELVNVLGR